MQKNSKYYQRLITNQNNQIPCYFYGYFRSEGLESYPDYAWVNKDYEHIKQNAIDEGTGAYIAHNLFLVGQEFNLFVDADYLLMMPLKTTSVSSLPSIVKLLMKEVKVHSKIIFLEDVFIMEDYRKFYQNRLSLLERTKEIKGKIQLKSEYENIFENKTILIIDDVVSTGTSLLSACEVLQNSNKNVKISALCYGSVYNWEEIYS